MESRKSLSDSIRREDDGMTSILSLIRLMKVWNLSKRTKSIVSKGIEAETAGFQMAKVSLN